MKRFFLYSLLMLVGLLILTTLFFTARQAIARSQVEREWQTAPVPAPNLETTSRLEIIPLYENASTDESFDFGHGVSYLVRTDSATIKKIQQERRHNMEAGVLVAVIFVLAVAVGISIARKNKK